ncbi:hypothetical protein [Roseateles sp. DXS20W]|uniref:hypothetical protein n=1 Tax=Pelomonas lactea TaxID=3299030 RepID=UPI003749C1A6
MKAWVVEALARNGGEAHLLVVARDIWAHHEQELRGAGDLFFSWQYDMRWACTALREKGIVLPANKSGIWTLADRGSAP